MIPARPSLFYLGSDGPPIGQQGGPIVGWRLATNKQTHSHGPALLKAEPDVGLACQLHTRLGPPLRRARFSGSGLATGSGSQIERGQRVSWLSLENIIVDPQRWWSFHFPERRWRGRRAETWARLWARRNPAGDSQLSACRLL